MGLRYVTLFGSCLVVRQRSSLDTWPRQCTSFILEKTHTFSCMINHRSATLVIGMSCNSDSFDLPLVLFSPWLIAEPAVVLCNQLNGTSVFIDLTLGLLARISGFDNHGNARKAAFSEKFCIAE